MLKANEIIILAYIEKYKKIDLYRIQEVIHAPVVSLVNMFYGLLDGGYIYTLDGETWYVSALVDKSLIVSWNQFTQRRTALPGDEAFRPEVTYRQVRFRDEKLMLPVFADEYDFREKMLLHKLDATAYHTFVIHQKQKERQIKAPGRPLKRRQQWILKEILEKAGLPDEVHGFVKGRSIVTNAKKHVNQEEILALDIRDFFPSVTGPVIMKIFEQFGYDEKIASELTALCTSEGVLPQGAPTSPYLANLAFAGVDEKLRMAAEKYHLVYTRYADDLTFSGERIPETLIGEIREMTAAYGFKINEEKVHLMTGKKRKMVTGLVVTDIVKVPAWYKRKLRQEIYYCKKFGVTGHLEATGGKSVNYMEYLYGKAYYIKMVEPETGEKFLKALDEIFSVI